MFEQLYDRYIEIAEQIFCMEYNEIDWTGFRKICEDYDSEKELFDFSSNEALWKSVVAMIDELEAAELG